MWLTGLLTIWDCAGWLNHLRNVLQIKHDTPETAAWDFPVIDHFLLSPLWLCVWHWIWGSWWLSREEGSLCCLTDSFVSLDGEQILMIQCFLLWQATLQCTKMLLCCSCVWWLWCFCCSDKHSDVQVKLNFCWTLKKRSDKRLSEPIELIQFIIWSFCDGFPCFYSQNCLLFLVMLLGSLHVSLLRSDILEKLLMWNSEDSGLHQWLMTAGDVLMISI